MAAPALEAVVPVIKRFKPEKLYQSETSDLVEEAWNRLQGRESSISGLDCCPYSQVWLISCCGK